MKEHPNCEWTNWRKLDLNKEEDRNLIIEYWTNFEEEQGTVEGLKVRDVKFIK